MRRTHQNLCVLSSGIASSPILSLIVILFVISCATTPDDSIPATDVLSGNDLSVDDRELLIANGVIAEGEKIEYFYSSSLQSILEDGSLLTSKRVISYQTDESDELMIWELSFPDIYNVELIENENLLNRNSYRINSYDKEASFLIYLSSESGGDVKFIKALTKKMNQSTLISVPPLTGPGHF